MGESAQVCAGSVTIYTAIQQEEICMGTTCWSSRYGYNTRHLGVYTIVCLCGDVVKCECLFVYLTSRADVPHRMRSL